MSDYEEVCGQYMDLETTGDHPLKRLNIELAVDDIGAPILVFQDWTTEDTKDLFRLHLKEATELKAAIENLLLDATLFEKEYVQELMEKPFKDSKMIMDG